MQRSSGSPQVGLPRFLSAGSRSWGMVALPTLLLALVLPRPAHAQDEAERKAAAEALFQEGRERLTEGKVEEACPLFERSQSLDPAVGTLLNLADCYERAGRLASAWTTYTSAVTAARTRGQQERAEHATARAEALRPKLATLKITVPAGSRVQGLVVRRDGAMVEPAAYDIALPVDAGTRRIEVTAPGCETWSTTVTVTDGAKGLEVVVPALRAELAPQAGEANGAPTSTDAPKGQAAAPGADATKEPHSSWLASPSGLMAIGGVVALGASGYFTWHALSLKSDSLDHCPTSDNLCDARGVSLRNDARAAGNWATVTGLVGGALLGGALVVYYLDRPSTTATADAQTRHLALSAGPGTVSFAAQF